VLDRWGDDPEIICRDGRPHTPEAGYSALSRPRGVTVFGMGPRLLECRSIGLGCRSASGRALLAILALFVSSAFLNASVLPGSAPKDWPANPKRHVITLKRTPDDESALKKIALAETAPPGTNSWSSGAQLGIPLPYSLTRKALEHYEGLIRGYQKRSWKTYVEPRSLMDYSAELSHQARFERDGRSFRDVDVVEMKLMFRADFTEEGTQGVHFIKTRTVVLDRKGVVLAVFGDGPTEAPVLAI
jgi:hypothetical protein